MKKILILVAIFISHNTINAQISYGVKAGTNYNFSSVKISTSTTKEDVIKDLSSSPQAGFNVGGFLRVKIPIIGIFVQGEPTYTRLNTNLKFKGLTVEEETSSLAINRFDFPVLVGIKMLAIARVYAGPVFSWSLGNSIDNKDIELITNKEGSVGVQIGAGVELGPIMLDARFEGGVKNAMSFAEKNLTQVSEVTEKVNLDNRSAQIILSVAYKF